MASVLLLPLFPTYKAVVIISRFLTGVAQSLFFVYFPVWIDLHGDTNKTLWLSYVQLTSVSGYIIGYVFTAVATGLSKTISFMDWKFSYYFMVVCLGIMCYLLERFEKQLFQIKKRSNSEISLNSSQQLSKPSVFSLALKNFQNISYMLSMLTVCALFFVLNAIQFWFADYMERVHKMNSDEAKVVFIFVSLTAPTLGLFIGGRLCQSIGGYEGPNSTKYCLILSIITCCVSLPIPYIQSANIVVACNWLWLFLGGALLPTISGMMISRLKPSQKNIGSSMSQFFINLLGYIPAPILYGMASEYDPNKTGKFGMKLLVTYQLQSIVLMIALNIYESRGKSQKSIGPKSDLQDVTTSMIITGSS